MTDYTSADFVVVAGHSAEIRTLIEKCGYRLQFMGSGALVFVRPGHDIAVRHSESGWALVMQGSFISPIDSVADSLFDVLEQHQGPPSDVPTRTFLDVQGHFACAIVTDTQVATITDHLGVIPVYRLHFDRRHLAGTNLDDLATISGAHLDPLSVDQFIEEGRVFAPFTLYRGITRQWPATICPVDTTSEDSTYWQPPNPEGGSLSTYGDLLRSEFRAQMKMLAQRTDGVSVLFSGGEDSRIVARAAAEAGLITNAIMFSDRDNREWRKARRSARAVGATFSVRQRHNDHYERNMAHHVRLIGPGIDLIHAHSRSLVDSARDFLPVLDGHFAALAKADFSPHSVRMWGRLPVSLQQFEPTMADTARHDPNNPWAGRIEGLAQRLSHLDPASRWEWLEQYPASDQFAFPFLASNRRCFESISPLLLPRMLDIVARVPIQLRLDRKLYREAFRPLLGRAAFLPRTGGEILGLSPRLDLVGTGLLRLVYGLESRLRGGGPQGSWQGTALRRSATSECLSMFDPMKIDNVMDLSESARQHILAARQSSTWNWGSLHRALQVATLLGDR